jgi:hypothetical protein
VPRRALIALLSIAVAAAFLVAVSRSLYAPFPSDHTPEGAYLRIARSLAADDVPAIFAYLETDAQWASFTIRDLRKKTLSRVEASYPEAERAPLEAAYRAEADAKDGPDLFAEIARRRGWTGRLRRDLSGIASVQIEGERATVVTARGTRYALRRRENGIWGLTLFTAELMAESERAARDLSVVETAADDYDRGAHR